MQWFKDFDDDSITLYAFKILKLYDLREFIFYISYVLIKLYIKGEKYQYFHTCAEVKIMWKTVGIKALFASVMGPCSKNITGFTLYTLFIHIPPIILMLFSTRKKFHGVSEIILQCYNYMTVRLLFDRQILRMEIL